MTPSSKNHPKRASIDTESRRTPSVSTQSPGMVVLFGSGEMSPTGRKIHESVFKMHHWKPPVQIGILETPTGFEVNARHGWPERMEKFLQHGLQNYKPEISRIAAWRRDGSHSTNDAAIVDTLLDMDYIYCGAGSPGYTIAHLRDTLAYKHLIVSHRGGSVLCLGSATAVAMSTHALPVYEIFKAGEELHWINGLGFFESYGLFLSIIPHWNNQEGEDFDTTYCWMGKERFDTLYGLLPPGTTVLGIDEQTACLFDFDSKTITVAGVGMAHIRKGVEVRDIPSGSSFSFLDLQ